MTYHESETFATTTTGAWKLSPQEVTLKKKIASGTCGEVWKGALHDRWVVAIKTLFPSRSKISSVSKDRSGSKKSQSLERTRRHAASTHELFRDNEIRFLIRTRHERLVMFLGCGIDDEDGGCFLVTEFMDGGSLDRALWNGGSSTISTSWMQRFQILLDVVDGLVYLHLVHKSVHLDLKSPNILLEKIVFHDDAARTDRSVTHRAKIADFGLSRIFNKGKRRLQPTKATTKSSKTAVRSANWVTVSKRTGFVGTPRWMAPEMMKSEVNFGPSADIYSFGVVMWEVWSGRKPWSELSDKLKIFKAVREDKRRLKSPSDIEAVEGYEDLMRSCTEYRAKRRPLIDSVRSDLQALLRGAAEADNDSVQGSFMKDDTKTTTYNELCSGSSNDDTVSTSVHVELGTIESTCSSLNASLESP